MLRTGYKDPRLCSTHASNTGLDRTELFSRHCKFVREFKTLVSAELRTRLHFGENACTSANTKRPTHQLQLVLRFALASDWPVDTYTVLTTLFKHATGLFCDCVQNRILSDAKHMNAHSLTGDTKVGSEEHFLIELKCVYSFAVLVIKLFSSCSLAFERTGLTELLLCTTIKTRLCPKLKRKPRHT